MGSVWIKFRYEGAEVTLKHHIAQWLKKDKPRPGGLAAFKVRLVITTAAELQQMAFKIDFTYERTDLAIKTRSSISKI